MAKAIMVQGTMSNAGKSIITAGLCRIFKQDGFKVAPFKAQNMALNSFITREGLEMGRAQVVQAEAAGIEPSVLMNPILLKPTNNTSSQVIVNGEVWQNLSAREYYRNKSALVPEVKRAFDKLSEEYDIIVIEGAGSPAEINLRDEDIVNMFMAKMADAPVLLVGDIDRGGVFASLIGTMALFNEEEKNLLVGFVINKFRGDVTILEPGLKTLEEMTGKKVFGVMPYVDVDIEDEDSLSERIARSGGNKDINIAVIRTPRISNFTDFRVFEAFENVNVKYVRRKDELDEKEDMILLPGTKNTMEDLLWMRQNGIEARVKKMASTGTPVFGICGGYQMLGEWLRDPHGVEAGGEIRGMGILPSETVFEKSKRRTRVEGLFKNVTGIFEKLSGMQFEGYEIHMGDTKIKGGSTLSEIEDLHKNRSDDGISLENVYGSYVHGIFDREGVADTMVRALMSKKGLDVSETESFDMKRYKEEQYDKLADEMRAVLDIEAIYRVMGIEK